MASPRDLVDFFRRWSEFRPTALETARKPDLTEDEAETLMWLVKLADRVSEHDITAQKSSEKADIGSKLGVSDKSRH